MIVPVMVILNLVLTPQIYSEEANGAHAHYREPVPLKRELSIVSTLSKALENISRMVPFQNVWNLLNLTPRCNPLRLKLLSTLRVIRSSVLFWIRCFKKNRKDSPKIKIAIKHSRSNVKRTVKSSSSLKPLRNLWNLPSVNYTKNSLNCSQTIQNFVNS